LVVNTHILVIHNNCSSLYWLS